MPVKPPALPPLNIAPQIPESPPPIAAWRWWIHLIVLASYVLGIGLIGALSDDGDAKKGDPAVEQSSEAQAAADEPAVQPALSANPGELLFTVFTQLAIFAAFFGVAWLASRARRDQLMLRWNRNWWFPWVLGLGYSFAMRIVIGIIATVLLATAALWIMASHGIDFNQAGFDSATTDLGKRFQPNMKHLVDADAIENSPLYLFLNATIVSFLLAGFREELWRAGMLAGCRALFPKLYETRRGQLVFVVLIAVVFGLGHTPQGLGGVFLTTLLGIMLGSIMVFHRSIWEATLAHGFFNAASFVGMHLLYRFKEHFPEIQKMLGGG